MEPGKEPRAAAATAGEKLGEPEPAVSFQARLWKNLQLGGKGRSGGGGRAAADRRTAEPPAPPAGGKADPLPPARWAGFRRRRQVLDRVFSSSQPNLCCSAAEPLEPGGESGFALRRLREHLLPQGKGPPPARREGPAAAPPPPAGPNAGGEEGPRGGKEGRRPGAHLSHQKSSSLPSTACLEQLLHGSPTAGRRTEPRAEEADGGSVSACGRSGRMDGESPTRPSRRPPPRPGAAPSPSLTRGRAGPGGAGGGGDEPGVLGWRDRVGSGRADLRRSTFRGAAWCSWQRRAAGTPRCWLESSGDARRVLMCLKGE